MFKTLALALALSPFAAHAADLPGYPFIHAGGEGFVMVVPDIGEIDFDISACDPDPAAAVATVQARAADSASPDYDIRSAVHITVLDLSKWRPIMLALLGMKNVDHLSTKFGHSDRLKVEHELTAAAVKDAQRRADNMAAGPSACGFLRALPHAAAHLPLV